MYAEIRAWDVAKSDDLTRAGKSMWVNNPDFQMELHKIPEEHLDNPPWYLEIAADTTDERGGELSHKELVRWLKLQITPADLARLLKFVLRNGLIQMSPVEALDSESSS